MLQNYFDFSLIFPINDPDELMKDDEKKTNERISRRMVFSRHIKLKRVCMKDT